MSSDCDTVKAYAGERLWVEGTVEVREIPIGPPPVQPTSHISRFRSAIATGKILTLSDIINGNLETSENPVGEIITQNILVPIWSGGRRYLYFGVDDGSGNISDIAAGAFPVLHVFEYLGVRESFYWYVSRESQSDAASNAVYRVTRPT